METTLIMIDSVAGTPPTSIDCKVFEMQHDFPNIRVLYDPTAVTKEYGGKETFIISNELSEIVWKRGYLDIEALEAALVQELETSGE